MTAALAAPALIAALLTLVAVVAGARLGLLARAGALPRGRAVVITALQFIAALLMYWTLFPPAATRSAGTLTVLTAAADSHGAGGPVVALPEFTGNAGLPVPDLATALRHHSDTRMLEIRGAGLTPRDLDAARGLAVTFRPAPLPRGLVELHLPARIATGAHWTLQGHAAAMTGGRVELRDPAGVLVAQADLDAEGRFALAALARAPGPVMFELRLFDADAREIERADVPVAPVAGHAPRVVLLAGAPNPELRFLRRWAVDAGVDLETRVQLSRGVNLGARPGIDAEMLRNADLLLLDERAWRWLDDEQRAMLRVAVRDGLGVLLRFGDVVDESDQLALAELGFQAENVQLDDTTVRMTPPPGPAGTGATSDTGAITLTRRPLRVTSDDGTVLLRSAGGEALGLWRNERLGRIALWWLEDSYRLALAGEPAAFASLWSELVATLGRPGDAVHVDPGVDAGTHYRRVLCGLAPSAEVRRPSGTMDPLVLDENACAAYWPAEPGWHALAQGGDDVFFHARPAGGSPGLDAAQSRAATLLLAAQPLPRATTERVAARGSPWGFFFALLIALASSWWLERRHAGS